jgi:transposase-like protein
MNPTRHPRYARHRFPAEVISHVVWLYFRFSLSLRMVEEMLAARGILVSHETVRQWAMKFGQDFANRIRRRERIMKRFKTTGQAQRFLSVHDQVANLFRRPSNADAADHRAFRA